MSAADWLVLFATLFCIVSYGLWKTKKQRTLASYVRGDNSLPWWMVGVSIMATQASAVTFLSTTGQGMQDGMRFLQFYFGLPLAMIIIAAKVVPIYYRAKVFTAYEYLEKRFDAKTRTLTAILFLTLRSMSAGITLYAPSIVLAAILQWNIFYAILLISALAMIYTVAGGSKAVSLTQQFQLSIIMGGMLLAGYVAFHSLPDSISFIDSVQVAGELGKLNVIETDFKWDDRFNIWSGLIASTFLFLSYFGADQSQVSRYLSSRSIAESRVGLLMNGLLKIPMQFMILLIGVGVFLFYQINPSPIFYNEALLNKTEATAHRRQLDSLQIMHDAIQKEKKIATLALAEAVRAGSEAQANEARLRHRAAEEKEKQGREAAKATIKLANPSAPADDRDYMFLYFVLHRLPHGLIGLLIAVVFCAAMSSLASELNALGSTATVDIYRRWINPDAGEELSVRMSRWFTLGWGLIAILFAFMASKQQENLIQFVNIVGSLFYGVILGIFLMAFYTRRVRGHAVFWSACIAETAVLALYLGAGNRVAFLYYNIVGCLLVVALSFLIHFAKLSEGKSDFKN